MCTWKHPGQSPTALVRSFKLQACFAIERMRSPHIVLILFEQWFLLALYVDGK